MLMHDSTCTSEPFPSIPLRERYGVVPDSQLFSAQSVSVRKLANGEGPSECKRVRCSSRRLCVVVESQYQFLWTKSTEL